MGWLGRSAQNARTAEIVFFWAMMHTTICDLVRTASNSRLGLIAIATLFRYGTISMADAENLTLWKPVGLPRRKVARGYYVLLLQFFEAISLGWVRRNLCTGQDGLLAQSWCDLC